MMDIVKLLREAGDVYHDIARDMLQNEWKEHLAPHYTKRGNELQAAADELEGDAERCKHGIRLPHECGECQNSVDTEAAVAWYAYESVAAILEPHMGRNGRDGILPASVTDAVQILLEHRLRHPPTERAVPEGWKLVPVEPTFEMLTAADTESVNKNGVMAMTRAYKAMLAAAPAREVGSE